MIHAVLVLIWLAVAITCFAGTYFYPESPYNKIYGTDISLGWFALVLVMYNLARWWSVYAQQKEAQKPYVRPPESRPDDNDDQTFKEKFDS